VGYPPAPQQESSTTKYIVIGCVVLLVLGLIIGGGCLLLTGFAMKKGVEQGDQLKEALAEGLEAGAGQAMDMMTESYLQLVSPDHTGAQKERFEETMDKVFVVERKRLGLVDWPQTYGELMGLVAEMADDGTITVPESKSWCDKAEATLKDQGQ
jgi:hypothetical protein